MPLPLATFGLLSKVFDSSVKILNVERAQVMVWVQVRIGWLDEKSSEDF